MSHEVFDTLNLIRDLQAQYAAFRAQQHFVTAHGMCCATTARLEAIAPKSSLARNASVQRQRLWRVKESKLP
jgi:hypothetical protein